MERHLSIIPKPVSINYGNGAFNSTGLPVITGDDEYRNEIETVTEQLRNDFDKMNVKLSFDTEKTIVCKKGLINEKPEAYKLTILNNEIIIEASSKTGAFHGLQTLRQLVLSEFCCETFTLPCAEITDYPRFSWRGFMLDCSRYFYSVDFIKQLIDVLSLHHISRFHWHLTDDQGWRFSVPEYPLLTEIGSRRVNNRLRGKVFYNDGFYTEEEIREIVDFASRRHIEIIPEVDLPGHASAILAAYPGLGCTGGYYRVEDRFGIFEDVLCAGNELIFDLCEKVFDTLVRLFPSKWVHIGGDEVLFNRWEECYKCQRKLAELGLKNIPELQSWITYRLADMLAKRDRITIGWDEILDDTEKFKLPKDAVVMSWRGNEGGVKASGLGHQVIMASNNDGCYLDYKHIDTKEEPGQTFNGSASVYLSYSMEAVTPEMENADSLILGGQCNLWSELIYAGKIAEYMIFPRLCAIAEAVWTPKEGKDFEDFSRRLAVHKKRLDILEINYYRGKLQP